MTNVLIAVGRLDAHTVDNHGAQQGPRIPDGLTRPAGAHNDYHIISLFIFDTGGDDPRGQPQGSSQRSAHESHPDKVTEASG